MIKVLLTDDHPINITGLKLLLSNEDGIQVIGEASNGLEAINLLNIISPDVIVMDLNMPEMDGFEATSYITASYPDAKILIFSTNKDEKQVAKALKLGALGYILKNTEKEELIHAIQITASGISYICSEITLTMLNKLVHS